MEKGREMGDIRYRERFLIRSWEVDPMGRARLTTIANFFQEAAHNHAGRLGVGYRQLKEKQNMWVLSRMRMQVVRYPRWEEEVVVETWPSGIDKLFALRDFRLLDRKGELLAAARSGWLILRASGRRPVRPENEPFFRELQKTGLTGDSAMELNGDRFGWLSGEPLPKLEPEEGKADRTGVLAVRQAAWSDLDVMGHVNNVKYMEWCLDALLQEGVRGSGAVSEFGIDFLREALRDQRIVLRHSASGPECTWVLAEREGDKKEIFRARIRTKP